MTTTSEIRFPRKVLEANYAPVADEITAVDLPVTGAIPAALNGRYLRNGPNPTPVPTGPYHWFLGDGMIHGVELREGRASWYRNRWVQTEALAQKRGTPMPAGPTDVSAGNPANTHIIRHAGRILALCEPGLPYQLSPQLDTIGRYNFAGQLQGSMTAHPKIDPVTGELLFFGYKPFAPYLTYYAADRDGNLVRSEVIDLPGPSMVHDFAITAEHVVFFDLPVLFDPAGYQPGMLPYRWHPEYGARVGVMPRNGGNADIVWAEVEPCYVFHPLNAYADNGRVVVDVVRWPEMCYRSYEGPFDERPTTLDRWTIDLAARSVKEERLSDRAQEFPRVDPRLVGRPHRYGYGAELCVSDGSITGQGSLLKQDLQRGTTEVHDLGPARAAGEGVFIPAREGAAEDEGYVMALVYDAERDASDLVILNAQDFAGEPAATVHLPRRVPFGFHGEWLPD